MEPFRGIGLKLASVVCFVVMAALVKAASDEVPPGEAVFFRSFFALPVIFIWLARSKQGFLSGLRVKSPMGHVWRGMIGASAMFLNFYALALLPLPEATVIGYAAPLLLVIFAAMFAGEEVRLFRLSAVFAGLVGVIIVLMPRITVFNGTPDPREQLGAMVALGGACLAAIVQLHVRNMVRSESTSSIVFWFSMSCTVAGLMTLPLGQWVVPSPLVALYLTLGGLIGGLAQVFLTSCYRYADASLLAPFDYASMVFALVIGYVVFGDVPTLPMLLGASIVISAGVVIILRERALGLSAAKRKRADAL
ncbi:DMT family transporter [Celeribacter neptunius]|uniref:Permease of the drug/metabolite transporter (DMT) superfamily n=1 Tax=Celeribacter neptunius TaxID=588602 RepID=A0A1I3S9B4_9RHOB|nr:DMT family transporter [Celeribacter neptunius]SFJ55285.1 Permease of the drug/metabolite transporter (DMT) superfamily [Celeribacter neptunius]